MFRFFRNLRQHLSNDLLRSQITMLMISIFKNLIDFETKDDHALQYNVFLPEVIKAVSMTPFGTVQSLSS